MYCTQDDLIKRFGNDEILALSDKENDGVINVDNVALAINDATSTINGYLGGRFDLPLSTVPTVLTRICAELARFHLYDDVCPDRVKDIHMNNIRFLEKVGKGELSLGLSDTNQSQEGDDDIVIESTGGVFGRSDNSFI